MSCSIPNSAAILSRFNADPSAHSQDARLAADGSVHWSEDLATATAFEPTRDASRLALYRYQ
jgi:hypothetical protein